ncbi:MAG: HlyC/CorC family transporter [Deltaproteobacteria bacterium]|nr:HlyC/CorC family transporter [Deltaproteobacteria bacterium]
MDITFYIIIFFLCLTVEAFFSGSEIALIAANPKKIRKSPELSPSRIKMTLKLLKNRERLLATTLCGTNLSVITNTILITSLFISLLSEKGEIYSILILSPLLLIFGEIIPKTFFQQNATRIAPWVSYPVWLASYLFYPLVIYMNKLTNIIFLLAGAKKSKETLFVTREELKLILKMSRKGSDLTTGEVNMINRLFDFSHTTVKEAMIPFVEVSAVEDKDTVKEAIAIISKKGYSRLPVYNERIDNIIGIVNSFDLLNTPNDQSIKSLIRTILFVPESKPIDELVVEMQKKRNHLAIVVDEYGGTIGIITIEDILEEIVGEIKDEYDTDKKLYRKIGWNRYLINARMEVDQIRELLPLSLPDGDFETLGGFLLEKFGHIPKPGETLNHHNLTYTIVSSDERSIGEVRIKVEKRKKPTKNSDEEHYES